MPDEPTREPNPPAPAPQAPVPTVPEQVAAHHLDAGHHHGHAHLPRLRFVEEIKRRNVGRVAILYIVVSYVVLEVFEMFFHLLEMPPWTGRAAVLLAVLGFPVALLVAWAYEITPEGLKPTDEVPPQKSIARQTGRRLDRAIIVVLGIALMYFVADKFWLSKHAITATPAVAASSGISPTIPEQSVAVLPFVDMSEHKDQEYFADGLTEELIDRLAQSPDLKVTARTSSFYYKHRDVDVRTIAAELGVRHLLEGSVRKQGELLRITIQLIRAVDGSHMWSRSYDRPIQNIFQVQGEIADRVTEALHVAMADHSQADRRRSSTIAAYDLVLQGDSHKAFNLKDVSASIDLYRRAIATEPNYALAWARLSTSLSVSLQLVSGSSVSAIAREAEDAADRALEIDPNLAYAYFAKGLTIRPGMDSAQAEDAFKHANALQPGLADRVLAETQSSRTGDISAAIVTYRAMLARDPKYSTLYSRLGDFLFHAGQYRESEELLRKLIVLEPGFGGARDQLIETLIFKGASDEALAEIAQLRDPDEISYYKSMFYWSVGRRAESTALLKSLKRTPGDAYDFARLRAYRGETEESFHELQKTVDEIGISASPFVYELRYDRYFLPMESDPRFAAILSALKL